MSEVFNFPMIWGGFAFGLAFGVIMQRSGFCMLAALSNLILMHDVRHLHAWFAALAIAIPGTVLLESYFSVDIASTHFRAGQIPLFGSVFGGLVFGLGTVLAGGCASRTLIRSSEGDLGAWITLLFFTGTAIITLFGVLAPLRVWLDERTIIGDSFSLVTLFGLPPIAYALIIFTVLTGMIILTRNRGLDWRLLLAGLGIGVLIVGAWYFTGFLYYDEFDPRPAQSLSISGPAARTGMWLATSSLSSTGFGVALIVGALLGGSLSALQKGDLLIKTPQQSRLPFLMLGGVMMGFGAVCAGGCNIGQGISGMSTSAISSLISVLFMFVGMRLGLSLIFKRETFNP